MSKDTVGTMTVDIRRGDRLVISGGIEIALLEKSGTAARLRVTAPLDVGVKRHESHQARTSGTIMPSSRPKA